MIYMAIIIRQIPDRASDLLKYMSPIREAATKHRGLALGVGDIPRYTGYCDTFAGDTISRYHFQIPVFITNTYERYEQSNFTLFVHHCVIFASYVRGRELVFNRVVNCIFPLPVPYCNSILVYEIIYHFFACFGGKIKSKFQNYVKDSFVIL